jgi:hypothetical protein
MTEALGAAPETDADQIPIRAVGTNSAHRRASKGAVGARGAEFDSMVTLVRAAAQSHFARRRPKALARD